MGGGVWVSVGRRLVGVLVLKVERCVGGLP